MITNISFNCSGKALFQCNRIRPETIDLSNHDAIRKIQYHKATLLRLLDCNPWTSLAIAYACLSSSSGHA